MILSIPFFPPKWYILWTKKAKLHSPETHANRKWNVLIYIYKGHLSFDVLVFNIQFVQYEIHHNEILFNVLTFVSITYSKRNHVSKCIVISLNIQLLCANCRYAMNMVTRSLITFGLLLLLCVKAFLCKASNSFAANKLCNT